MTALRSPARPDAPVVPVRACHDRTGPAWGAWRAEVLRPNVVAAATLLACTGVIRIERT